MEDEEIKDPLEELKRNIDFISPVKKCPKCKSISLEYDDAAKKIKCSKCGFEVDVVK